MASYKQMLSALTLEYDKLIPFVAYYKRMFPEDNVYKTMKCRLHRERKGESFSILINGGKNHTGIWSCFGECKTSGGTCKFHYKYLKNYDASITLLGAIRSLHLMYPATTPDPDIWMSKATKRDDDNKLAHVILNSSIDINKLNQKIQVGKSYSSVDEKYLALAISK